MQFSNLTQPIFSLTCIHPTKRGGKEITNPKSTTHALYCINTNVLQSSLSPYKHFKDIFNGCLNNNENIVCLSSSVALYRHIYISCFNEFMIS